MTLLTEPTPSTDAESVAVGEPVKPKRLALVASKGTLDQAYPPLILATTAASLGWEAGIYFTFYGLDVVHKKRFRKLKVASLANPAGPVQLPNLLGAIPGATAAATGVMKKWMRDARMPPVSEFLEMAQGLGVKFFACSTTMGVMGVEAADLLDGCLIAGAAAFLDYAAEADVQLFI
ncbi:MAG: DsrE/DsrF/DrsH-like family protein [Acidimicrobiia bacterium]